MHPLALQWLDDMPPFYREDPLTQAVLNAQAGEMARVQAFADALMNALPYEATDSNRMLSLWELQTGLPVAVQGVLEVTRRAALVAHISRRAASSEEAWASAMTEAIGSTLWSYETETTDGEITVHLPFAVASPEAQRVRVFARAITPAHLTLIFQYGEGFIFDDSPFDTGEF